MAAVTNTFTNGTGADADEVNENFQDVVAEFDTSTGHNHDGINSKKVPTSIVWMGEWVSASGDGSAQDITLKAFSAADVDAGDVIKVTIIGNAVQGSVTTSIRITGPTNAPYDIPLGGGSNPANGKAFFYQNPEDNTELKGFIWYDTDGNAMGVDNAYSFDTGDANWIEAAWTVKVRISAVASGKVARGFAIIERYVPVS